MISLVRTQGREEEGEAGGGGKGEKGTMEE